MSDSKNSISTASASIKTEGANRSPPTNDRVEWSRATILGFIEDYRSERVLWDPNTKGYHIKQTKYEALKALGHKYGTEIRSIRSKIKSLRSSFHREHGKVINGRLKGVHYQPMWFAYEAIRFILDGETSSAATSPPQQLRQRPQMCLKAEENFDESGGGDNEADVYDGSGEEDSTGGGDYGEYLSQARKTPTNSTAAAAATTTQGTAAEATKSATAAMLMRAAAAATQQPSVAALNAYALAEAADNDGGGSIVARVAAAVAAAAAAAAASSSGQATGSSSGRLRRTSADEFAAVTRSDLDGDMQSYCNITAEDVKTEIIESDTTELAMLERQTRTPTPLPLSYNSGGGGGTTASSSNNNNNKASEPTTSSSRKRKQQTPQHIDDAPSPVKKQHLQQQQPHSTLLSKQRDLSPATVAFASSTSNTATAAEGAAAQQQQSLAQQQQASAQPQQADEYGIFGEYVAITIRKLKTSKAKIVVKHLINNLLYEAELGKYDQGIPSSKEPPQLYKM